jgi:hypothetical protein
MLAVLERRFGYLIVRPDGIDDRIGIHLGLTYQLMNVAMHRNPGMRRLYAFAGCGSLIANADHLAAFEGAQIANNIWSPITVADNTKPKHKNSLYKTVW